MTNTMKIPRDQPLFFTVFFTICFGITLAVWIALPTYHESADEEEGTEETVKKILSLEESIERSQQIIMGAEAGLAELENPKKKTGAVKGKEKQPAK